MKHAGLRLKLPPGVALFVDPPIAFDAELGFEVHSVAEAKKLVSELARVIAELDTVWFKPEPPKR